MASGPQSVQVTWQDQQNINAFNRLNTRMHDINAQIKAKKRHLEDLEDAGNELMLADDEEVRYAIGECLVYMDKDQAEAKLQDATDAVNEEVKGLKEELVTVMDSMAKLKVALYAKFGSAINLEED